MLTAFYSEAEMQEEKWHHANYFTIYPRYSTSCVRERDEPLLIND